MPRFIPAALWAVVVCLSACTGNKPPQPTQLLVTIDGMHCEDCAQGITKALADVNGVLATDVHFSNRIQSIRFDAACQKPDRLISLIADRGYEVKPVAAATPTTPAGG